MNVNVTINIAAADVKCPISDMVPTMPVLASDGYIYESKNLLKILLHDKPSPVTNENLGPICIDVPVVTKIMNNIREKYGNKIHQDTVQADVNVELLKCPISHMLFDDPVLAKDSVIYERSEMSKKQLEDTITRVIIIKKLVRCAITSTPELASITHFSSNSLNEIDDILRHSQFNKLLEIPRFSIKQIVDWVCNNTSSLFKNDQVMIHIIDHSRNLEECSYNDFRLVHLVAMYSSKKVMEHLVKKNIDLECITSKGKRPIHIAYKHQWDVAEFLVSINAELECECNNHKRPIHIACKHAPSDAIIRLVENKVDINIPCKRSNYSYGRSFYPMHILCFRSTRCSEAIEHMIKHGADLECVYNNINGSNWTPLHVACRYSTQDVVIMLLDHGADFNKVCVDNTNAMHMLLHFSGTKAIRHVLDNNMVNIHKKDTIFNISGIKLVTLLFCRHDIIDVIDVVEHIIDNEIINIYESVKNGPIIETYRSILERSLKRHIGDNRADKLRQRITDMEQTLEDAK